MKNMILAVALLAMINGCMTGLSNVPRRFTPRNSFLRSEIPAQNGYLIYNSYEEAQAFISRMNVALQLPQGNKTVYATVITLYTETEPPAPTGKYAVRVIKKVWSVLTEDERSAVVEFPPIE